MPKHFSPTGRFFKRRLQFERLEPRRVLAGMVSVALHGGDLVLHGDAESNKVGITIDGDQIVISRLDDATQINGQAELRFEASALTGTLRVNLRQGDDTIRIGGEAHDDHMAPDISSEDDHEEPRLSVPGDMFIATGPGSDNVRISFVEIGGGVFINTAGDMDLGDGEGAVVDNPIWIEAESSQQTSISDDVVTFGRGPTFGDHGHGDDEHSAIDALLSESEPTGTEHDDCGEEGEAGPPADVTVGQGVFILTGPGEDAVKVAFTEVAKDLRVLTGPGSDYVVTGRGPIQGRHGGGGSAHEAGVGFDTVAEAVDDLGHGSHGGRPVDLRIAENFRIDLGPGDDFAMLRNSLIGRDLMVAAQPGNDSVGAQNLMVQEDTSIRTGTGDDLVALLSAKFGGVLNIDAGPDRDLVLLHKVRVSGILDSSCGSGDDALAIAASQFADQASLDGGSGWDRLGLGVGDASNEFELTPSPDSLVFEELDSTLIDEAIATMTDRFGGFLQGAVH